MVKNKLRIIKVLFASVILLFFGFGSLQAQVTLSLPNNLTGQAGQILTVPVSVNTNGTTVTGYNLRISYNPSYVSIDTIDGTGTLSGVGSALLMSNNLGNQISIGYATMGTGITGSGTLVNLKVKLLASGTSALTVVPANSTYNSGAVFNVGQNGNVTVADWAVNFPTLTSADNKHKGDTIEIPITINAPINGQSINAYQFQFTYNSSLLQFINNDVILAGTASQGGSASSNFTGGTGNVSVIINPAISSTSTTLLKLRAIALAKIPGGTPLTFTNWTFYKSGGTTLAASTFPGSVVTVNRAPYNFIANPNPAAIAEGSQVSIVLSATDDDGDVLTFANTAKPTGGVAAPAFNAATKTFTWTPDYNQSSATPYNVVFTVTDGEAAPLTVTVPVTVSNTNRAPSGLNFTPNQSTYTVNQGSQLSITLNGTDPDVAVGDDSLSYSYTSVPATNPAAVLNAKTGVFTWTPAYGTATPGTYTFTFKVQDLAGLFTTVTKTVVVNSVNNPPSWTAAGAAYMPNTSIREGQTNSAFQYKAIDPEGANVTYQVNINQNGSPVILSWISINPNTGLLTINPRVGDQGTYNITVAASDGVNNSVLSPISVLTIVPDAAPSVVLNPSVTSIQAVEGQPISAINVTTSDPDAGDSVKISVTGLPAWANFPITAGLYQSGVLSGTPAVGSAGTYTITFTGKDLSNVTFVKTLTINVYAPKVLTVGTILKADGTAGAKGDTVLIPVNSGALSTYDQVTAYNLTATFTPGVLNIIGYQNAGTLSGNPGSVITLNQDNVNGTVQLSYINPAAINSPAGVLLYIKAKLVGKGTGAFTVNSFNFNAGIPPVATPFAGSVTVANRAPVLQPVADVNGTEGAAISFTAQANDADGDAITYSTNFAPAGTSLVAPSVNPTTGVFTWTPGYLQAGSYDVTISANDGTNHTEIIVKIIVADANRMPSLTLAPAVPAAGYYEVNLLSTLSIQANGTDPDADNTLTYSISNAPLNAQINPTTGLFTFTPDNSQTATYSGIVITVQDGKGGSATQTISVKVNTLAPSFSGNGAQQLPSVGTQLREGQTFTFTYKAVDPQGLPLTYFLTQPTPSFASIDATSGKLTLKPLVGSASEALYQVIVVASNGISQCTSVAYVKILADAAPVLTVTGQLNITVPEETPISFSVNTTDADAGDSVKISNTSLTAMTGATFTKTTTGALQSGTFNWTPGLGKAGSYSVTFTATDLSNVSSAPVTVNITVTKHNYAPVITAKLADQSVAAGTTVTFKYTATDQNNDPLTWSVISPAGATIATDGSFSYTAVTPGTVTVTVQVTDGITPTQTSSVLTVSGYTVSGKVTYGALTGKALANVKVSLKKDGVAVAPDVTTDATGTYSYANLPQGTYSISFSKTDEWGGVNAADALVVSRYVAYKDAPGSKDTLDAIQLLAADVDANGQVNNTDALRILYRYVGRTDVVAFVKPDWVFLSPATVTLTNANVVNNVLALATGDVNKSLFNTVAKVQASALNGNVIKVNAKASFEIPVTANMISDLGSISMKLSYPAEYAKLTGVVFNKKLNDVVYKNNANEGTIAVAWISDLKSEKSFDNKEALFTLKFTATEKFQKGNSFALTLDPSSELTLTSGAALEKSSVSASKVEVSVPEEFSLKQNYPNPFNPTTTIQYDIPVNGKVKLVVSNILGQEVAKVLDAVQDAGTYKVNFDASRLASGTYLYTITVEGATQKYVKTNKMVLMK
jgi:hypothetical protein